MKHNELMNYCWHYNILEDLLVIQARDPCIHAIIIVVHFSSCYGDILIVTCSFVLGLLHDNTLTCVYL